MCLNLAAANSEVCICEEILVYGHPSTTLMFTANGSLNATVT